VAVRRARDLASVDGSRRGRQDGDGGEYEYEYEYEHENEYEHEHENEYEYENENENENERRQWKRQSDRVAVPRPPRGQIFAAGATAIAASIARAPRSIRSSGIEGAPGAACSGRRGMCRKPPRTPAAPWRRSSSYITSLQR